jgi:hypothetical protein
MVRWTTGYKPDLAMVSSTESGTPVIFFAIWELVTVREFIIWWHDRWHHPASCGRVIACPLGPAVLCSRSEETKWLGDVDSVIKGLMSPR